MYIHVHVNHSCNYMYDHQEWGWVLTRRWALIHGDGHLIYIQDPVAAEKAGKPGDELMATYMYMYSVGVSTATKFL